MSTALLTVPYPPGDADAIARANRDHGRAATVIRSARAELKAASTLESEEWQGRASEAFAQAAITITGTVDSVAAANTMAHQALDAYADALRRGQHQAEVARDRLRDAVSQHNSWCHREIDVLIGRVAGLLTGPLNDLLGDVVGPLRGWQGIPPGVVRLNPTLQQPRVTPADQINRDLVDLGFALSRLLRDLLNAVAQVARGAFQAVLDALLGAVRNAIAVVERIERGFAETVQVVQRLAAEAWGEVSGAALTAAAAAREVLYLLGIARSAHPRPVDTTPVVKITDDRFQVSGGGYGAVGGSGEAAFEMEQTEHESGRTEVALTFSLAAAVGLGILRDYVSGKLSRTTTRRYDFNSPEEASAFRTEVAALLVAIAAATGPQRDLLAAKLAKLLLWDERGHFAGQTTSADVGVDVHAGGGAEGLNYAEVNAEDDGEIGYDNGAGELQAGHRLHGSFDLSASSAALLLANGQVASLVLPNVNGAVHLDGDASAMYHLGVDGHRELEIKLSGTMTDSLGPGTSTPLPTTDGVRTDVTVHVDLTSPGALLAASSLETALSHGDPVGVSAAVARLLPYGDHPVVQQFDAHRVSAGVDAQAAAASFSETVYTART